MLVDSAYRLTPLGCGAIPIQAVKPVLANRKYNTWQSMNHTLIMNLCKTATFITVITSLYNLYITTDKKTITNIVHPTMDISQTIPPKISVHFNKCCNIANIILFLSIGGICKKYRLLVVVLFTHAF